MAKNKTSYGVYNAFDLHFYVVILIHVGEF